MKRNIARFLPVLLLLSLCLLCTACSGGGGSVDGGATIPQEDPNEGWGDDFPTDNEVTVDETGLFEGIWLSGADNPYDYIEFDDVGNWQLYTAGDVMDDGYLWYDQDEDTTYIYSYQNSDVDGGMVLLDDDELYVTTLGSFTYGDGMVPYWYEDGGNDSPDAPSEPNEPAGNGSGNKKTNSTWSADLYQQDVSEYAGVWYFEGDLSASIYIVIDENGTWSYYQRAPGDAEGTEMDWGTFSYSKDEVSTYYADSAVYDGVSYRVFEFDYDTLIWDDDLFYSEEYALEQ